MILSNKVKFEERIIKTDEFILDDDDDSNILHNSKDDHGFYDDSVEYSEDTESNIKRITNHFDNDIEY